MSSPLPPFDWDIFCAVVDNFGDIGVTWRLARQLQREGHGKVRLWVDDELRFEWFASPFFGQLRSAVKLPAGIHAVRFEVVHDTGPIEAALD